MAREAIRLLCGYSLSGYKQVVMKQQALGHQLIFMADGDKK